MAANRDAILTLARLRRGMGRGRLAYIDGLRGIAVAAVLFSHIAEEIERAGLPSAALSRMLTELCVESFNGGRFGVALFFLVSGFVIPFSLGGGRALPEFAVARAVRLLPALWVSIAAALPVIWITQGGLPGFGTIIANAAMVQTIVGLPNVQNAYWTLPVELVFYALAAVMFSRGLLGFRAVATWSVGLLVVSVLAALVLGSASAMLPRYLSLMLLGTTWRRALLGGGPSDMRTCWWLTAAHFAALPILYGAILPDRGSELRAGSTLSWASSQALAILLFIATVIRARSPARLTAWFGRISYSVYLVHGLWLAIALAALPPGGHWATTIAYVALVVSGTTVSALMMYHGVERPALALHHRLGERRTERTHSYRRTPDRPQAAISAPSQANTLPLSGTFSPSITSSN